MSKENIKIQINREIWSDTDKSVSFRLGNDRFVTLPKSVITVEGMKRSDFGKNNDTHIVTLPVWLWEKNFKDKGHQRSSKVIILEENI